MDNVMNEAQNIPVNGHVVFTYLRPNTLASVVKVIKNKDTKTVEVVLHSNDGVKTLNTFSWTIGQFRGSNAFPSAPAIVEGFRFAKRWIADNPVNPTRYTVAV